MPTRITDHLLAAMALAGSLAAILTLMLTPVAAKFAVQAGAVAIPRGRDVHDHPVPRWGGLALFAGFLLPVGVAAIWLHSTIWVGTLRQGAAIIIGAAIISLVGALDDRKELRPLPRLGAQLLASVIAYMGGVRVLTLTFPFSHTSVNTHWLSMPITVFWMMLIMNAINWLDGLDGLAGGVCVIIALFLALTSIWMRQVCLGLVCVVLAGSILGFLRYNYSPARIYMGGGAEFLGYVLACISIIGAFKQVTTVAVLPPLVAMAVPIVDSVHVVLRRLASREPIYQADQRHFHHLLLSRGLTKTQAVLVVYALTMALCVSAWMLFRQLDAFRHQPVPPHAVFSAEKASPPAPQYP